LILTSSVTSSWPPVRAIVPVRRLEVDDVGAGEGVGLGDGGAERAGAPVGQGRDLEGRRDDAVAQRLQPEPGLRGPPRA
jgi:hypothetical protein